jgi:hypothetical protein
MWLAEKSMTRIGPLPSSTVKATFPAVERTSELVTEPRTTSRSASNSSAPPEVLTARAEGSEAEPITRGGWSTRIVSIPDFVERTPTKSSRTPRRTLPALSPSLRVIAPEASWTTAVDASTIPLPKVTTPRTWTGLPVASARAWRMSIRGGADELGFGLGLGERVAVALGEGVGEAVGVGLGVAVGIGVGVAGATTSRMSAESRGMTR